MRIVSKYVEHYNHIRLHSAIGYVAPADKLAGREAEIFAGRDRKLAEARSAERSNARLPACRRLPDGEKLTTIVFDLGGG